MFDWNDWNRRQAEWYTQQVEWYNRMIDFANKDLKYERDKDRELFEYVWGKGVITEWEARIYGYDINTYVGSETKKILNERNRYYRQRKRDKARAAEYTKLLEGCK